MSEIMKEVKFINGECGENINVYETRVKAEDIPEHAAVAIEMDGLIEDSNGDMVLILSAKDAIELAEQILDTVDIVNETNYHILVNKVPSKFAKP